MICPKCKENTAHRSERTSFADHTANRFFFKPYSCGKCSHRFYALRRDLSWDVFREDLARLLRAYRFGREGKRRRRELAIYLLGALAAVAVIYFMVPRS